MVDVEVYSLLFKNKNDFVFNLALNRKLNC